jgi:hypothetical protein
MNKEQKEMAIRMGILAYEAASEVLWGGAGDLRDEVLAAAIEQVMWRLAISEYVCCLDGSGLDNQADVIAMLNNMVTQVSELPEGAFAGPLEGGAI